MNMYRMAALGVVVSIGIAGCDSLDSESRVDRPEASMTQNADADVCDRLTGNAKDVCVEEAESQERVAEAEFAPLEDAREEAMDTMQGAEYGLAREKCDALAGDLKDDCVEQAKADFAQN